MDKPKTILVLVHQGFSHLDDIQGFAQRFGISVSVLSSAPSSKWVPLTDQAEHLAHLNILDLAALNWLAVKEELIQLQNEFSIVGVFSTYEGYRVLMAQGNEYLNIKDSEPQAIKTALDKLNLRAHLNHAGLSDVKSSLLTQSTLGNFEFLPKQFIKPRYGINSFGCVSSDKSVTWEAILELQEKIKRDQFLNAAFFENVDFISEDYIGGLEFSFEVLAVNGDYHFLGVHEKVGILEEHCTVLETLDVSPPISIDIEVLNSGQEFIVLVLKSLTLDEGIFHIEAKWEQTQNKWEIIEVNPRMGGGLIDASVLALTNNANLIELWLMSLLRHHDQINHALNEILRDLPATTHGKYTVSAYCFGEPGMLINAMIENKPNISPVKSSEILTIGDYIPDLNREVPVKEAMWLVEKSEVVSLLDSLKTGWIDVKYVDVSS